MTWQIELTKSAEKDLKKIDRVVAKRILSFLRERIATSDDPRSMGKALTGKFGTFWRYRVGDCRVICDIQDNVLCVLVVKIGNRRDIYS